MTKNRTSLGIKLRAGAAALVIGAAVIAAAGPARAGVIVDTMSGGHDTVGSSVLFQFTPPNIFSRQYIADLFNTGAHTDITSIALPLTNSGSDLVLHVYADNNGKPGADIFTQDLGVIGAQTVTLSDLSIPVAENTDYWLGLTPATFGSAIWYYVPYNNGAYVTDDVAAYNGTTWTSRVGEANAFMIAGDDAAPEPASLALMAAGLAGLGFLRRRRLARP